MDIERSIDGMVGRLMSWLTLAPIRAREDRAEDPAESRAEAPAEVVEAMVETVEEVAGAVAGKAEETGEAEAAAKRVSEAAAEAVEAAPEVATETVDEAGEVAAAVAEAVDPLEQRILQALAACEDGAALRELKSQTGGKPTTLRARLNRLIARGRVQRRGQGMRTRYHLVAEGQGDD